MKIEYTPRMSTNDITVLRGKLIRVVRESVAMAGGAECHPVESICDQIVDRNETVTEFRNFIERMALEAVELAAEEIG